MQMNKKQIIQISVIIVAFGASGFVLYNGFFKGSGQLAPSVPPSAFLGASSSPGTVAGLQNSQAILPAGDQLDFTILKRQNLAPQGINYPELNPDTDVGIPEANLITPTLPASQ